MCGIAGILTSQNQEKEAFARSIEKMTDALKHRGPDDSGYHIGERIALGHRRLSIIDLSRGHQPIYNEDGTRCIVFNGEIYNYLGLKKELESLGHRFSTNSDTETILHAYEQWGDPCVERLRGMFAFAIWDAPGNTLFLARDRFGKKPLFYAEYDGKFVFASEMKSILLDPSFRRRIDQEALAAYFLFSYIPAPLTIFQGIAKLLPGHTLTCREGKIEGRRYWDLHFRPDRKKKESDFLGEAVDLLRDAVRVRLMSEVPLGAFLSGGVDSSAVVALMSGEMREPVKSFTIGFGGTVAGFDDERKYARMVADRYATAHTEYEVAPTIEGLVEEIIEAFDEPFADDSTIPSYYVCQMARRNVTVALSGLGGDEAFAGYERYLGFRIGQFYKRVPGFLRESVIRPLIEMIPENESGGNRVNHMKRFVRSGSDSAEATYLGFLTKISGKYREDLFQAGRPKTKELFGAASGRFSAVFRSGDTEDPLNRVFYTDVMTYLPDDILALTDRMSMWHSLEVRVPFLDHPLMEWSATIPPEMKMKWLRKKYLLKKAVRDLLPEPILTHKKQGFVGPMGTWIRTDLKGLVREKLSEKNFARHGLINYGVVRSALEDHDKGRELNDTFLWSLLIFQAWFDKYME